MITANTLTATILITDTATDTVVRSLPCRGGRRLPRVNFGAKQAWLLPPTCPASSPNDLIVVDPDPNNDGNPIDAKIVGRVLLTAGNFNADRRHTDAPLGDGRSGRAPDPSRLTTAGAEAPQAWKNKLTPDQRNQSSSDLLSARSWGPGTCAGPHDRRCRFEEANTEPMSEACLVSPQSSAAEKDQLICPPNFHA